ncbi:MAG: site-specific DNA-methyltransferase [bacterium]|nr:site-specific DNA-methyltransferase [bacterium]
MGLNQRKRGTKTSAFGSPGRVNHDSTPFYTSRLYEGLPKEEAVKYVENCIPPEFVEDMLDLGFLMRSELIWSKASSGSPSTAWGSWLSAKNPTLRDIHEYILVFSKGMFTRENMGRKSTISKAEFLEFTKSVWTFAAEPATKIGHPAPFPLELPYRLIQLYTFEGEIVLDPFIGSGQTAIAAIRTSRHYIGYEINEEYVKLAERRIKECSSNFNTLKLFK